jgi:hypothetical protein
LSKLGADLAQFWRTERVEDEQSEKLVARYPEVLLIFHRWEREGKDL